MANENETLQEDQEQDYIEALTKMRENSVPKEQYAKLKEENAKLLKSLLDGETIENSDASAAPDVATLRKELFNGEDSLSNLDYVTKALQLRQALIDEGKPDPFLPIGHQIAPTVSDIEAANRVAKVMQECVDEADGDSALFTSLLMRETVDSPSPRNRK